VPVQAGLLGAQRERAVPVRRVPAGRDLRRQNDAPVCEGRAVGERRQRAAGRVRRRCAVNAIIGTPNAMIGTLNAIIGTLNAMIGTLNTVSQCR
jgi:hypothetical protein